jgi:hypothetical protein
MTGGWRYRKDTLDTLGGTEDTRVSIFCVSTSHFSRAGSGSGPNFAESEEDSHSFGRNELDQA